MTTEKNLGIWMDGSSAHIMEFTTNTMETKTIEAKLSHPEHEHSAGNGEHQANNKERGEQSNYYKKLAEVIKQYDSVILFGPTNAKSELLNILRANHLFEKIKIEVKQSDKMTENQQHAFVKDHFSK